MTTPRKPETRKAQCLGDTPPKAKAKALQLTIEPKPSAPSDTPTKGDLTRVKEDAVDRCLVHYGDAPNAFDGLAAKVGVLMDRFSKLDFVVNCDVCVYNSDQTLAECPFCASPKDTQPPAPSEPELPIEDDATGMTRDVHSPWTARTAVLARFVGRGVATEFDAEIR